MKRHLIIATLALIFVLVLGLPLVSSLVRPARAAALLDMSGQKIVVMTADEFLAAVKAKDDEIARLTSERKKDCGLI